MEILSELDPEDKLKCVAGSLVFGLGVLALKGYENSKRNVALIGNMGVGKTTLFNILLDDFEEYKINQKQHKSTPKLYSKELYIPNRKIYDTSSAVGTQADKESELNKFSDKDTFIFVVNGENIDEDVAMKIKCYKNTYKQIKDFKLIVTRAKKIQNKNELHNKLAQDGIGVEVEFFELVEGIDGKKNFSDLRDKIIKFVEKR